MADRELIIKIPEGIIEYVKNNDCLAVCFADEVAKAIKNGIQLPAGHGKLIDVNEIPIDCDYYDVDNAPTLIEADKEENGKMLICPECGLDVHSDYKMCPRCGARIEKEVEE